MVSRKSLGYAELAYGLGPFPELPGWRQWIPTFYPIHQTIQVGSTLSVYGSMANHPNK